MRALLKEIDDMIIAGNQRMLQREELSKSAILKANELFSAMKKPSMILMKPSAKKTTDAKTYMKKTEQKTEDIILCKICGKSSRPGDVFCAGCGIKIENVPLTDANTVEIPFICSCGKPWREGTLFCGSCGAKRPVIEISSHICPKGHINTPEASFCYVCGERII